MVVVVAVVVVAAVVVAAAGHPCVLVAAVEVLSLRVGQAVCSVCLCFRYSPNSVVSSQLFAIPPLGWAEGFTTA